MDMKRNSRKTKKWVTGHPAIKKITFQPALKLNVEHKNYSGATLRVSAAPLPVAPTRPHGVTYYKVEWKLPTWPTWRPAGRAGASGVYFAGASGVYFVSCHHSRLLDVIEEEWGRLDISTDGGE